MTRKWQDLEPVNWRLLVRLEKVEQEEISAGGIIIGTASDEEYRQSGQIEGHIMAVGPVAGKYVYWPDEKPQEYKVGDKVQFHKLAGMLVRDLNDGYVYRWIQDSDIQGKIKGEEIEV